MTQKRHTLLLSLIATLLVTNGCALLLPKGGDHLWENDDLGGPIQRERAAPIFNRLTLGLEMPQVVELWGKPTAVDAAGDPKDGNQRWSYSEGVAGRYGLESNRVVYFEQGRVAGWESR